MKRRLPTWLKAGGWLAVTALLVLATRVLVYALVPRPSLIGDRLEYTTGGPRLVVVTALVLVIAGAVSSSVIWAVSMGVRERTRLEPGAVAPVRMSPRRVACVALALWLVGSLAFAGLESYLHWRGGLGWHGLHCLTGPVHRDATPILGALSLVLAVLFEAASHLLAWMRRIVRALRRGCPRLRPSARPILCTGVLLPLRSQSGDTRLGPRAPPGSISAMARRRDAPSIHPMRRRSKDMTRTPARKALAHLAAGVAALMLGGEAWAHAEISPPVAKAKAGQLFTLAVPTEEENATTTAIELTPPAGFAIDSFVAAPGWKRKVQQTGSGEEAVIQKVTWTGGNVPTGEDSVFQFLASPDSSKAYTFGVRQTYSNGKVVDWAGPESSDTPAPTIEAKSSLGGGGSSILAIVALVVGALGLLVGVLALAGGKRPLA